MAKERLQQVGFAGLIGAVAGATLTAHRGRPSAAVGALAGAAGLGAAEAVARARQRPGEIPRCGRGSWRAVRWRPARLGRPTG